MMRPVGRGQGADTVTTNHGCAATTTTAGSSSNVLVNDIGIHRFGDTNTVHQYPVGSGCGSHQTTINTASSTVFANGKGVVRRGDSYTGGETVSTGSSNVRVGY